MITRNHRGNIIRSHRHINTNIRAELLIGDGWEAVAHAELKRLSLEVSAYHNQLENCVGYEETGKAVKSLQAACQAIETADDPIDNVMNDMS